MGAATMLILRFEPRTHRRNGGYDGRQHQCGSCPDCGNDPAQPSPGLLGAMMQTFVQALIGAEVNAVCGAPAGSESLVWRSLTGGISRKGFGMSGTGSDGPGEKAQLEPLADSPGRWLDFESLKIPIVDGIGISVTRDDNQNITNVILESDSGNLEVTVFAANPGHSLWEEICSEMRAALFAEGLPTQELDGEAGTELLTRRRDAHGVTPLRFVGIDGPGWMIRGVYMGRAAVDTVQAAGLANCLRKAIVRRSNPSLPERSPLSLTMPPGTEQPG